MAKKIIDIEKLVHWAIVTQNVEAAQQALNSLGDNGLALPGRRMQEMVELGTPVQQGYADRLLIQQTPEDAFLVFSAVCRLPAAARDLVVVHAKLDSRPDWYPEGAGGLVIKRGKFNNPVVVKDAKGNKHHVKTWDGTPPHIVNGARAEYVVWWEGLNALAINLENNLASFKPHPPRAARAPWDWSAKKVG